MRFDEPGWWYGAADAWQARALAPVGALVGHLAARRLARTTPYRARLPVICVGNFTAGGTGKTPLALHIVAHLQRLGRVPVCLTRGYGGRIAGPHLVDLEHDIARQTGDEPLLLARRGPTVIARDRAAGARFIETLAIEPAPDVIVMDDGLQNPALAKSLTIAVVDGQRGFGNGRVLPAGPLRAPLDMQLPLAEVIVVNGGADGSEGEIAAWLRSNFTGPVLSAGVRPVPPVDWLTERPLVAYCGIGAPKRFFGLLASLGGTIVGRRAFPDHHAFTQRDAGQLLALAKQHDARLVTTEKDLIRLHRARGVLGELQSASRTLAISVEFDQRQALRLAALLETALARR